MKTLTQGDLHITRKTHIKTPLEKKAEILISLGINFRELADPEQRFGADPEKIAYEEFVRLRVNRVLHSQLRQIEDALERLKSREYAASVRATAVIPPTLSEVLAMYKHEENGVLNERRKTVLLGDTAENGKLQLEYDTNRIIFQQGEPAESVFYLRQGTVKLSVTSQDGKEAIVCTLGPGEFFGEECLADRQLRLATAVALTPCALTRIEKKLMARMLHEQHEFADLFVAHLLSRNIRYEADLVDQLFHSSEQRLARTLLRLSHFGKESRTATVIPSINQENLAQMVGTTRSRVSHFMHKFRKLGFIDYGGGGLTVRSSLRRVVPHDNSIF